MCLIGKKLRQNIMNRHGMEKQRKKNMYKNISILRFRMMKYLLFMDIQNMEKRFSS